MEFGRKTISIDNTVKVTLPKDLDCDVVTKHHSWRSDAFLGFVSEPRVLPVPMNLSRLMGPIGDTFTSNSKALAFHSTKPVSLANAIDILGKTEEVYHPRLWELWLPIALAVLASLAAMLYACKEYRRVSRDVKVIRDRSEPMSVHFGQETEEETQITLIDETGKTWEGKVKRRANTEGRQSPEIP